MCRQLVYPFVFFFRNIFNVFFQFIDICFVLSCFLLERFVSFVNFESFLDLFLHSKAVFSETCNYSLLLMICLAVAGIACWARTDLGLQLRDLLGVVLSLLLDLLFQLRIFLM